MINNKLKIHKVQNNFKVDFNLLATKHPALYPYLLIFNYKTTIDFNDQHALITLTQAIMKVMFHREWKCPLDNLCPRIPNRLNYLLWVKFYVEEPITRVIDVGTGATLIYPLLGEKMLKWKFIATESNPDSAKHAQQLVEANNLSQFIQVRNVREDDLLSASTQPSEQIDVSICNPPFFDSENPDEPLTNMLSTQHHIKGGQYNFFRALYDDSFRCANIKNFTCLLGRRTTFTQITELLQQDLVKGKCTAKYGQIQQGENKRFVIMWKPTS